MALATLTPHSATATLAPTFTPPPTDTPVPTATLAPTETLEPTASPEPTATATLPPTATAEPSPTVEPTPEVAIAAVAAQVELPGIFHEWQRLNNCGPVSTAMALSFYGSQLTQYDIAPVVKGGPTDTNASPHELSRFIQEQGFAAPVRVNGDLDTLRALLSNNIPVIVEQWLERPDDELTAHYRVVRGYDMESGVFIVNDSYTGPSVRYSEGDFDRWWRAFHRLYIPVYRAEQEPLVRAIVGEERWPDEVMWQQAAARARQEVESDPNLYSWYNLGEAQLRLGDVEGAVAAFEQSFAYGWPVRMPWYLFAHLEAFNVSSRYDRVLEVTQPYVGANVEEIHYQRGVALEGLGRPQEALVEYQTAVGLNPRMQVAVDAAERLASNL
ncbi:MAG: C39 family peptidase [Chloroflexota bacterium]|nr:C39 family peptidase [Chloroflexota bacterium]